MGTQDKKGVEPTTGLVETLGNEVTGEGLFELLDVLEGVVLGSVGHGTRLEPAVKDLLDTFEDTLALLAGNGDVVDFVTMEIVDLALVAGKLLELLDAANADNLLTVVAHPQRNGSTPVPVTGDVPVTGVGNPAAETLLLDEGGNPVGALNVLQHLGDDVGNADEPRGNSLVDEGLVGTVAHGVRMLELGLDNELSGVLEVLDDVLVGLLYVHAGEVGNAVAVVASLVDRVGRRALLGDDTGFDGHVVIVLTEGGGLVDDTGTAVVGDVGSVEDLEGDVLVLVVEVVEGGLVLPAEHVLALDLLKHLELGLLGVLVEGRQELLEEDVVPSALLVGDLDVFEVGVGGQAGVRGEGPWRSGPGKEAGVGVLNKGEGDNDGGIGDVLVVLVGLKVGEGGGEGGRVGHDAVATVDLALVEQLLEDPPLGLHEGWVHGLVVVVKVDPAAETLDGVAPLLAVPHDDGAALGVVLFEAHLHDGGLARDAQLLVDLVLDGQAVGVPAEAALDVEALHGPVSGDDVLDGGGQQVAVVGEAGREGRAIVEGVEGVALGQLDLGLKGLDLAPSFDGVFLFLGEIDRHGGRTLRVGLREICQLVMISLVLRPRKQRDERVFWGCQYALLESQMDRLTLMKV